jgi:invasion protein IalB
MRYTMFWAVLLGGLVASSASAQEDTGEAKNNSAQTRVSGWQAQCASPSRGAALTCNVEQAIFLAEGNQQLAKVSVRVPGDTRTPEMVVQLPHGLYLPFGVQVIFDEGGALTYPIHTCDAKACYVIVETAAASVTTMKKSKLLKLAFKNLSRDEITVSIPLEGFSDSWKKVE